MYDMSDKASKKKARQEKFEDGNGIQKKMKTIYIIGHWISPYLTSLDSCCFNIKLLSD